MSVSETLTRQRFEYFATVLHHELAAAGDVTPAVKLAGEVAFQATGAATSATFVMERSTIDPASGSPNWIDANFGNSGSVALAVGGGLAFVEPAVAWWRVRATAMTGGPVLISISGGGA